jgi:hypothetical protein
VAVATPFSQSRDPRAAATLSGIQERGGAPAPAPPQQGGNELAQILTEAFRVLASSPPEMMQANLATLQQFLLAVQELSGGGGGGEPQGAPLGQAPR